MRAVLACGPPRTTRSSRAAIAVVFIAMAGWLCVFTTVRTRLCIGDQWWTAESPALSKHAGAMARHGIHRISL